MIQVGDKVQWLDHLVKNKRIYLRGKVVRIIDHGAYLTGQINYHNQEVPLDQLEVITSHMKRNIEDPLYWNTVQVEFFKPFAGNMGNQSQSVLKAKKYVFHIPRAFRNGGLQSGSIVLVASRVWANGKQKTVNVPAVIVAMYREEIELTGKKYMPVVTNLYSDYRGNY